jgi:hypothetical protein
VSPRVFLQTFALVLFGLWFVIFGIAAFIRTGNSQAQVESKLESIQAGKIQPDKLSVVRKYVNPGRSGLPHVVFRSKREPKVDMAVTVVFFNSVNLGDTISGYYFPDGYFVPQNHRQGAGGGKWFFLGIGVLIGGGSLALAVASARKKPRHGDIAYWP